MLPTGVGERERERGVLLNVGPQALLTGKQETQNLNNSLESAVNRWNPYQYTNIAISIIHNGDMLESKTIHVYCHHMDMHKLAFRTQTQGDGDSC